MQKTKKRRKELEEEEFETVEVNALSGIIIDRIDIVPRGSIGRNFHLLKSKNPGGDNDMDQTVIKKDIAILAAQLGPCPADLQEAVGYISKSVGRYGEVSATSWAVAKLLLQKMLDLAKRLKTDDPPRSLLVNVLTGLLDRPEFWIPTKSPRGMPGFSKAKAGNESNFAKSSESALTAVETVEILAKAAASGPFANDVHSIEQIRGDIWEKRPDLLRKALMEHHEQVAKFHEDRQEMAEVKKSNGTGQSAVAKAEILATEMLKYDSGLSLEQARGRVYELYPQIFEQSQQEFQDQLPANQGT